MSTWKWIRFLKVATKFYVSLFWLSIVCTVVWCYTAGDLYDHDDGDGGVLFGFVEPGNWVDDTVVVVPQVVHGRNWTHMTGPNGELDPDQIKEGWSTTRLWCLWWCFLAVDLGSSAILARISWHQILNHLFAWSHIAMWLGEFLTGVLHFLFLVIVTITLVITVLICLEWIFEWN